MLKGKTVLLGVTGGIACYKSAGLASALVKQGANVQVLMTRNATEFIGPHTFESLTGNRVSVDTFDRNYQFQVEHIALADQADLVLVAPATALVPLGDMVISMEHVAAQAREYGHAKRRELSYLVVHSVLHLLGYDHLDEGPQKAQMRAREEAILGELGIGR